MAFPEEAVTDVRSITPEQLYDRVSKVYANVAIVKLGDTWVIGRMVPLMEVQGRGTSAVVRRLGAYGIEVLVEAGSWEKLIEGISMVAPRLLQGSR